MESKAVKALASWIDRARMSKRAAAAEIGITEQELSQVLNGTRGIGLEMAFRIEDHTGIPARLWRRPEVGGRGRRRPDADDNEAERSSPAAAATGAETEQNRK